MSAKYAASTKQVPETILAWVLYGKEDMRLEERSTPALPVGSVLVEIGSVGVCGSDKHFYFSGQAASEVVVDPVVLGHEFGGRIVAISDGIDPGRLGQRVSVEPLVPDWSSQESRSGRYNIDPNQKFFGVPGTDGALQQYLPVPDEHAFAIPDAVSDDASAMVEPISVSLNGLRKAHIRAGSRILIAGGGPVGLFAAQLAFLHGAGEVALAEPQEYRRAAATKIGCQVAADIAETGGGYDAFVECSGIASVRHDGCLAVRPGGRVVFVGVGAQDALVPMPAVIEREVTIHGVMRYAFTWLSVIRMLSQGRIDADSLVSRRLAMRNALQAWTNPLPTEIKTIIRVNP